MKLYVLFYENGSDFKEDGLHNMPTEVFASNKEREARIEFIKTQIANDPYMEDDEYEFVTQDLELMTPQTSLIPARI